VALRETSSRPSRPPKREKGLTSYRFGFLESAEREFRRLPKVEQLLFEEKMVYLLRNPFQSHPWLRVRQGARHPGEWRFHLGEYRVFYRVDGLIVVFTRIVLRPRAYPRRTTKARRR
jgi:mRNA-degrading endonuclease RelE of RelBE toxin-antitoxin system